MTLYERVADLPLTVEDATFERRARDTSGGFERVTTVVELRGDGAAGRGEDVTYDAPEHDALLDAGPDAFDLPGEYAFDEFSAALSEVDLFSAGAPGRESFRHYRQWAFESAALDLALKQADTNLGAAIDRTYDPVRFVVSTRLGDPPTVDRIREWLTVDPELEFKLDPTPEWTPDLAGELAETEAVRILDLKGHYRGTEVDAPPDPALYRLVFEEFPESVVEDPALVPETRELVESATERISWDAPIESVADVEALPFPPRWLNVKPSRFGSVESLFETLEHCAERDVILYGGGQYELDAGRDHLHALASLFYPDGPNDVAPTPYNDPEPSADVPPSPLEPAIDPDGLGFRD